MGRQIHFYMLPEDQEAFLRVVQEHNPIVVVTRDSDSAEVQPTADRDLSPDKTLCLWNRKLLPDLKREWVPNAGYYTLGTLHKQILQFMPSFAATWEGKPALGQGRLFGNFEPHLGKPEDFGKWYESLVHWVRQHYRKNPVSTGGYVGPAAYVFYKNGGYLLPNFLPPRTKEWLTEIGKQHARAKTARASPKRTKSRP